MNNVFKQINFIVVGTLISSIAVAFSPYVNRAIAVDLATNNPYTQNFDTLANSGSSSILPQDWSLSETGVGSNTSYAAGDGSSDNGNTYSFGATNNTDRALGGLRNTVNPTFGVFFTNSNSTTTITSLNISYKGEQWRRGGSTDADRLDFQYSTNATSLNNGTWNSVNSLDFSSPVTGNTVQSGSEIGSTPVNGNIPGLTLTSSQTLWIRWQDFNVTGDDDGLGIDDLTVTAQAIPEPLTIIGSATALLFGGVLKRKFNLKKKLIAKQS